MKISSNGIDLIKQFEGIRLTAYQCQAGVWTIGYGHTTGVKKNDTITKAEALNFLITDLKTYEKAVNNVIVNTFVTQNMYDACVSLCFNIGQSAFRNSTLAVYLKSGLYYGASLEFLKWNKYTDEQGKKLVSKGLDMRRKEEQKLFLLGYYDKPTKQVTNITATKAEIMWLQIKCNTMLEKLGFIKTVLVVDGLWGKKTAEIIQAIRYSLGWEMTKGYTATVNLIRALDK